MINKRKGITLIALVVTIIILLILAGVTIALILGPDGVVNKARESKDAGRAATLKDRITVWLANNELKRKIGESEESIETFLSKLQTEGLLTADEVTTIESNSYNKLDIGKERVNFTKTDSTWLDDDIENSIKVGDRVYYDPRVEAEASELTYTSEKGSSKAAGDESNKSGNGHSNQTFTVNENDCNWIVLSKKGGVLKLISEYVKQTASNENFTMEGPTAYLYAEQELNNICSIYGHGKGLNNDASYIKQPKIGSPDVEGDLQNANLIQSGARSISIEDITGIKTITQKDAATLYYRQQVGEENWYNTYFRDYFNTTNRPESNIRIPTLTGEGHIMGKPLYTYYNIHKDDSQLEHMSDTLKNLIFKWTWVSGLCVHSNSGSSNFSVHGASSSNIGACNLCYGYVGSININDHAAPVRPIISLHSGDQIKTTTRTGYKWEVNQD